MTRFNNYTNTNNAINNVTTEARNSERVAEVNRNVSDMRSDILRLKIMVQAMMEIMIERGVDPSLIDAKIDEIMDRRETFMPVRKASKPCPNCGRTITDNGSTPLTGTCLYCGTVVKFPPEFRTGNNEPEDSVEDQNTMPM